MFSREYSDYLARKRAQTFGSAVVLAILGGFILVLTITSMMNFGKENKTLVGQVIDLTSDQGLYLVNVSYGEHVNDTMWLDMSQEWETGAKMKVGECYKFSIMGTNVVYDLVKINCR